VRGAHVSQRPQHLRLGPGRAVQRDAVEDPAHRLLADAEVQRVPVRLGVRPCTWPCSSFRTEGARWANSIGPLTKQACSLEHLVDRLRAACGSGVSVTASGRPCATGWRFLPRALTRRGRLIWRYPDLTSRPRRSRRVVADPPEGDSPPPRAWTSTGIAGHEQAAPFHVGRPRRPLWRDAPGRVVGGSAAKLLSPAGRPGLRSSAIAARPGLC
jgi:hypothetical protein